MGETGLLEYQRNAAAAGPVRAAWLDIFRGLVLFLIVISGIDLHSSAHFQSLGFNSARLPVYLYPLLLISMGLTIAHVKDGRGERPIEEIFCRGGGLILLGLCLNGIDPDAMRVEISSTGALVEIGLTGIGRLEKFALAAGWFFCVISSVVLILPIRSQRFRWLRLILISAGLAEFYWVSKRIHSGDAYGSLSGGIITNCRYAFTGALIHLGMIYIASTLLARYLSDVKVLIAASLSFFLQGAAWLYLDWPGHVTGTLEWWDNLPRAIDTSVYCWGESATSMSYRPERDHSNWSTQNPFGLLNLLPALGITLAGVRLGRSAEICRGAWHWRQMLGYTAMILVTLALIQSRRVGICLSVMSPLLILISLAIGMVAVMALRTINRMWPTGNWARPFMIIGQNATLFYVCWTLLVRAIPRIGFVSKCNDYFYQLVEKSSIWRVGVFRIWVNYFTCGDSVVDGVFLTYSTLLAFLITLGFHLLRVRLRVS